MNTYELKESLRDHAIKFLLWALGRIEPCKNNTLSYQLHKIADQYDTMPTGKW